jgi:hypothetical protein
MDHYLQPSMIGAAEEPMVKGYTPADQLRSRPKLGPRAASLAQQLLARCSARRSSTTQKRSETMPIDPAHLARA